MTAFVGVQDMVSWVRATGIEPIVRGITAYLREDFVRWEQFDKIPRIASHTPFGVIELMPTSDRDLYGFKYVNGHPANPARGFSTVTAFGVLADVDSGYPRFVAEMTLLTALRTAAVSALAARTLARSGSTRMALIGTGSQSEFQALGIRGALGISDLAVYDVDPDAIAKFVRNLPPRGFTITVAGSAAEACEGADVITTCTADKARAIVLRDVDVRPGVHINAVGGDCPGKTEVEPSLLDRSRVFVEYTPQTRIEGEIQARGDDFVVTELWEVLAGRTPGRVGDRDVTLFDSVGFAIEDLSALRYVRDAVEGTPFVTDIDLVAEPEDPKDLFGMCDSLVPIG